MESRNRHQSRSLPIIKQKGTLNGGGVALGRLFLSAKVCTSCVQPLGLFLSRGSNCPKCGLKVCKKCKVHSETLPGWICLVCSKELPKSMTVGPKSLKYSNNYSNIKRSWSISAANRGSPILKAYTKYNGDERGYSSLPRMPTTEAQALAQANQSPGRNRYYYDGGHSPAHRRRREVYGNGRGPFEFPSSAHQSTLFPYHANSLHGSPASSINFIEDEYWDYYDYEVNQSDERSSCERSLGDTVEYRYQHFQEESHFHQRIHQAPPKKPARTKKGRSRSVGSYDVIGAQLKPLTINATISGSTVDTADMTTVEPTKTSYVSLTRIQNPMYSSLPIKKRRSNSCGKENVAQECLSSATFDFQNHPTSISSSQPWTPERPIRNKLLKADDFNSHSLPRRTARKMSPGGIVASAPTPPGTNTYNTLPKEWKIFKRKDNNTTTIVISGINSPPNPSITSVLPMYPTHQSPTRPTNLSRTYISDTNAFDGHHRDRFPPKALAHRKFPIKEPYPSFPSKIQPFKHLHQEQQQPRELRPLLPLYRGDDQGHGLFDLVTPSSHATSIASSDRSSSISEPSELCHPISLSPLNDISSDSTTTLMTQKSHKHYKEVIIPIECAGSALPKVENNRNHNVNGPSNEASLLPVFADAESPGDVNLTIASIRGPSSPEPIKLATMESVNDGDGASSSSRESRSGKQSGPLSPLRESDKSLWTLCDPISDMSSSCDEFEPEVDSDGSFQSVVDNNSTNNNELPRASGMEGDKDRDELFKSCIASEEEDANEELEQIRRLLRVVDAAKHTTANTAREEPLCKNSTLNCQGIATTAQDGDRLELPSNLVQDIGSSTSGQKAKEGGPSGQDDDAMSLPSRAQSAAGEFTVRVPAPQNELLPEGSAPGRMNSDSGLSQQRRYKSRVLIGLNAAAQTVEVKGESEVEIVIGQGTYFRDEDHCERGPLEEEQQVSYDKNISTYPCRQSPEGEESGSEESQTERTLGHDESKNSSSGDMCLPAPSRSEPDGADAEKSSDEESGGATTPILEMNSEDDGKSESTDSWTEEVTFEEVDNDLPAPLDMTLHTICEESETESEYRKMTPVKRLASLDPSSANQGQGLERYFNFTADEDSRAHSHFDFHNYEESEFSDTFSESSFSSGLRHSSASDLRHGHEEMDLEDGDAVDLASGRLEKYFMNLGVGFSHDSDSVGSESETGGNVLENKKKVLKHHRRSAEYEDEHFQVSEDDDCAFEQEGFDTIKKQRKLRKSQEDLLSQVQGQVTAKTRKSSSDTIPEESRSVDHEVLPDASRLHDTVTEAPSASTTTLQKKASPESVVIIEPPSPSKLKRVTVSRSNSFNWSSDEEVNLMMRSLRQLIKNMTLSKKTDEGKGEKLLYLENELIRLMKTDNGPTVDNMSSDSEAAEDMYKLIEKADAEPELLSKVMTHIGQRLSTWMKDGEETVEEAGTIKTAQSVSSDLNDDLESDTRFSWKGSFESTLAKRQSVGSSDSLDYYAPPPAEGQEAFPVDRSILRSSSLHHLAHSQPILEESESLTSSLPRLNPVPASASSGSGSNGKASGPGPVITKSKSLFLDPGQREVKSARYRPPGYLESHTLKSEAHSSTPVLSSRRERDRSADGDEATKGLTIRGLMEFSMQYNYKLTTFEVAIKQCRDLAAVDAKKGRSDPYVKGYLLPDRSKSNKRKTKSKKNTLNPVFGETLKFPISLEDLEGRTLWLSVWHSDMFGKNEFLGQVSLPLKGLTFDDPNFTWYPLRDEKPQPTEISSQESPPLDLVLALKWTPRGFSRDRGNLSVLFKEAKGLKLIKNSVPSTFIKCYPLNERTKKQKTSLAKRTTNPVWNATMTFENVGREGLEVTLYASDRLNHESIGSLQLNADFELWRNMERREGFWVEGIVQLSTNY